MKNFDIARSAVRNGTRNKVRTSLTVIAIFIGAFTLTITNGIGTGINAYIDGEVSAIGGENSLTLSKTPENESDDGIREYDASVSKVESEGESPGPAESVEAISPKDIDEIAKVDGIESAEPRLSVSTDYIRHDDGTPYEFTVGSFTGGTTLQLVAGDQLDNESNDLELVVPLDYVDTLGFETAKDAIDEPVILGLTDARGKKARVEATSRGIRLS